MVTGVEPAGIVVLGVASLAVLTAAAVAWALCREGSAAAPLERGLLVEAMDDPVVVLDGADRLVDYNPAASETLGVDDGDVGGPVENCLHGLVAALDADGAVSLATAAGETVLYDPRPTPLPDGNDVGGGRMVVLRDVTLLKRREQTLAALQSATRELMQAESEETVAAVAVATAADVLDHPFAGFLSHDPDRAALVSTTLTQPVASTVAGGEMTFGPDDGLVWEAFDDGEVVVAEDLDGAGENYPGLPLASAVLLPLGDHGLLWVGSTDERAYSEEEVRFLRTLASATASTLDRLARERQLREHRDALEERNERLENFAGIVSHDLLTPLTTATGYLALARQEHDDEEGYLERVADSHERMDSLVEDVLALARQGQVVDEPEPVPVQEVALNAWQTAGHVDAEFDVGSFPGPVLADRERVRTLLENLLGNAVEHGSTGSPTGSEDAVEHGSTSPRDGEDAVEHVVDDVSVRVGPTTAETPADGGEAAGDGEFTGFYVADDGPGIPVEEREAVLEQGYSGGTGTGLGLAIVDRIAGAHDWTVTVTESAEGGARFEFTGVDLAA
jgi:signal transduction histidine kinase